MRDLIQNVGNVFTIQHQTCVDEIFKCTIFVGYGGVIFFYRCSTIYSQVIDAYSTCADPENFLRGGGRGPIPRRGQAENFNMAKINNLAIPGGGVRTPCLPPPPPPPLDPPMINIVY